MNRVKYLKDWTKIPCLVYNIKYCKFSPLVCCDIKSEDEECKLPFWGKMTCNHDKYFTSL